MPEELMGYVITYGSMFVGLAIWFFIAVSLSLSGVFETIITLTAVTVLFTLFGAEIAWRFEFGESLLQ